MLIIGSVFVVLSAGFMPVMSLLYIDLMDSFSSSTTEELYNTMCWVSTWLAVLGACELGG